ncbi:MAG TPA: type II TA system antitoxin MqsA family protein, partial [Chlamydiales bacterium]|nr:type II TA system antitoxin MqsA family protein [Chlamydiales bacterium]
MPKCLKCNDSVFEVKNLRVDLTIKKQTIEVVVPSNVCKGCNAALMNSEQMNLLRKMSADKYREINGLLTSKEIIAFREKLGLSQIAFARYLNVGEASIKRWETYYIQDESQDDHIRIKCDQSYSEAHSFYLQCKYGDVDIYSGLKSFSAELVKRVYQYFEKELPDCSPHLSKLHFYTDFLHFKRHNKCITGLRYIPSKSGPSPYNYNLLTNFVNGQLIRTIDKSAFGFDDREKQTMEDICALFLRDNGQMISQFSAQEKGYLETEESNF